MTFGYSRDDAEGGFLLKYVEDRILPYNPFQTLDDAVVGLMRIAVEKGRSTRPRHSSSGSAASTAAIRVDPKCKADRPRLCVVLAVPVPVARSRWSRRPRGPARSPGGDRPG